MPQILEHYGPLDPAVLSLFETERAIELPTAYRSFLLEFNGGHPAPNYFKFKDWSSGSLVQRFLGIDGSVHSDLVKYLQTYRERIPTNFFPIAYDPGGNLLCISIAGDDVGKIYFWDHEMEADDGEQPDYSNVILIADSFDEFISKLGK